MNLEDWERTPPHAAVERIAAEARARGIEVDGSELVGLMPAGAAVAAAGHVLLLPDLGVAEFSSSASSMPEPVCLTGRDLDPAAVWRIAVEGASVEVEAKALADVAANRAALEAAIARGDRIYGVTTGLGALVRERVSASRTPPRCSETYSEAMRPAWGSHCRRRWFGRRSQSG